MRVKADQDGYSGGWYYDSTGEIRVAGDHECDDVACTEHIFDFGIPLDASDLSSLSNGDEVTKQLFVGNLKVLDELGQESEDPGEPVYRTVKVLVSKQPT